MRCRGGALGGWCRDIQAGHGVVRGLRMRLMLGILLLLLLLSTLLSLAFFSVWRKIGWVYILRPRWFLWIRPLLFLPYQRMRCRGLGVDGEVSARRGVRRDWGFIDGGVGGRGFGIVEFRRLHFHRGVRVGITLGGFRSTGGVKRRCCD